MRVFMTGATGVIGRRAIPLLIQGGHEVTAVGRTEAKRDALTRQGARAVAVDQFDRAALTQALEGQDAVINLATHIPATTTRMFLPWSWKENDRLRRDGSRLLAEAAQESGVTRFIQESFAPAYPDRGDRWIGEETPLAPTAYNLTLLDAERSAERFTSRAGHGVVLRFAGFYGPDGFAPREMVRSVQKGWSPLPGRPEAYLSAISHDDAASSVVAALEVPAGVYNVSDDSPLTRGECLDLLTELAGVGRPRPLPGWAVKLMGSLGDLLSRSVRMSNAKLRAAAPGWRPRYASVREGFLSALHPTGSPRPFGAPHPAAVRARR